METEVGTASHVREIVITLLDRVPEGWRGRESWRYPL
jgi:hypothetical protein